MRRSTSISASKPSVSQRELAQKRANRGMLESVNSVSIKSSLSVSSKSKQEDEKKWDIIHQQNIVIDGTVLTMRLYEIAKKSVNLS